MKGRDEYKKDYGVFLNGSDAFIAYYFCGNCGTKKSDKTISKPLTETNGKMEGDGFASPEEALGAYIEGLKNNDIDQMLAAFAIETYAQNYSILKDVECFKAFLPARMNIPAISDFSLRLIIENRRSKIMESIRSHYLILQKSKTISMEYGGKIFMVKDYDSAEELLDDLFVKDDLSILL